MKIGFALGVGVVIVLALAITVVAWIKGGTQPAHMVEIPIGPDSGQATGA